MKITFQDALNMLRQAGNCKLTIEDQITVSFGKRKRFVDFQDSIGSLVLKSDIEKICNELRVFCQI